ALLQVAPDDRRHLFLEDRDADDADVLRPARARRIGIAEVGEVERGGTVEALAPAGDFDRAPWIEHVTGLRRRGRVARDDVHAIHTGDDEHAAVGAVADAHRVFV